MIARPEPSCHIEFVIDRVCAVQSVQKQLNDQVDTVDSHMEVKRNSNPQQQHLPVFAPCLRSSSRQPAECFAPSVAANCKGHSGTTNASKSLRMVGCCGFCRCAGPFTLVLSTALNCHHAAASTVQCPYQQRRPAILVAPLTVNSVL